MLVPNFTMCEKREVLHGLNVPGELRHVEETLQMKSNQIKSNQIKTSEE
jgi:hypothetical protein